MLTLIKKIAYGVKVKNIREDDYESDIWSICDKHGNWRCFSDRDKQVYRDQDTDQWCEYYAQPSSPITLKGSHAT
jgi:hypothetical protein